MNSTEALREIAEKWGASMGHGFTNEELSADLNSLSLPPADGAEEILHKYVHTINSDGTSLVTFMGALKAMREFAAQQQPTAEGAEQVQRCPVCMGKGLVPNSFYATTSGIGSTTQTYLPEKCRTCNGAGVILPPYIHTQKIADKKVGEKLREELIAYDTWASKQGWDLLDDGDSDKYVDEYLKSREK